MSEPEKPPEDQPVPVGNGCAVCGDFPVNLFQKCHPGAPLRAVVPSPGILELRCYVPTCNRMVVTMAIDSGVKPPQH